MTSQWRQVTSLCQSSYAQMLEIMKALFCVISVAVLIISGLEVIERGLSPGTNWIGFMGSRARVYPWFKLYLKFVSDSLSYITIATNEKTKFNPRTRLCCWICFDSCLRQTATSCYFGGTRSKGFATLRNVSKLPFFGKIGHANFVGFRFYSAIWRSESRISSRSRDHFDFFDLFFNFFEEERIIILAFPGFEPTHLCDPSDQRRF